MIRIRGHSHHGDHWRRARTRIGATGLALLATVAVLEASAWGQQCKLSQGDLSITRPDPALDGQCWAVPANRVYVPLTGGSFVAKVSGTQATYVTFPEWVDLKEQLYRDNGFEVAQVGNTVRVAPDPALERLPAGESTDVLLITEKLSVTMTVEVPEDAEKISRLLMVTPLPPDEYARRMAEAEAEKRAHARRYDAATRLEWHKEVAHMIMDMKELRARGARIAAREQGAVNAPPVRYAEEGEQVSVLTYAVSLNGDLYLEVTVDNRTTRPLTFEKAWLTEGERDPIVVEMIMDRGVKSADNAIAIVSPDTMIRGVVLVPDSVESGVEALNVALTGPNGAPGILAKQFVELYPVPDEVRKRRRLATQVAFSVRLLGGGFWTDDAAGQDLTDSTSMAGIAVRLQKGYRNGVALEGEVAGGRSGVARFDSSPWGGNTGDITRQASFARMLGGIAMRFGHTHVFTGRGGIGVQLIDYDSHFIMDTNTMTGPGDGLDVDLLLSVGVEFTSRLGEHWTVGLGGTFSRTLDPGQRALEAGLNVGYGWNP